jgi:hypothetical protein
VTRRPWLMGGFLFLVLDKVDFVDEVDSPRRMDGFEFIRPT